MKKLLLKLSLSKQNDIEAEVVQSPAGNAWKSDNHPETEVPGGFSYRDLASHKITLLKALASGSFSTDDFPKNDDPEKDEQSWLVKAGLLDEERQHFISLQRNIGYMLYQAMFHSNKKAEEALRASLAIVSSDQERLHIQLMINADDEQSVRLFDYPWELLHDGNKFLIDKRVLFSRYIAYGEPAPELFQGENLNVLLVSLNAFDQTVDLPEIPSKEYDEIRQRLEEEKSIRLMSLTPSSFDAFIEYLTGLNVREMPHIIHFHGHGLFGKQCKICKETYDDTSVSICGRCSGDLLGPQGYLLFKSMDKWPEYVSAKKLSMELNNANLKEGSRKQDHIALVVLSACQSGLAIKNPSIFNGIVQSLIGVGIPAVVGMQFTVNVLAAADFARRFYSVLGRSGFLFDAMASGIVAMDIEGDQWYRPVLYTRWEGNENGKLFETMQYEDSQNFVEEEPLRFGKSSVDESSPPPALTAGSFFDCVKEQYARIQEKDHFVTDARDVFKKEIKWADQCDTPCSNLQEYSSLIQEFVQLRDNANVGKLKYEEARLRNALHNPLRGSSDSLSRLISQIGELALLLKDIACSNKMSNARKEYFASKQSRQLQEKAEKLQSIRKDFESLTASLEQLDNIIRSSMRL